MAHCYHFSLVCVLLTAQDNDLLDVGAYLTNTLEKLPLSNTVSKPDDAFDSAFYPRLI